MRSQIHFLIIFAVIFLLVLSSCSGNSPEIYTPVNNVSQVVLQSETSGQEELQEFNINNCDGKADATRAESRSSSVDASVSTELAAKIGASAEVVFAEVQASVRAALQFGNERETSIELIAPPNTHMYFQLAWIGKSQIGIVQDVKSSGIPVAFQAFTPTDVRIKSQFDIGCPDSGLDPETVAPIEPTSSFSPSPKCPSTISRQQIEQWAQIGSTSKTEAKGYIDEFDRMRVGGEFSPQDTLPAGVAIITDFGDGESYVYQTFPVRAIAHYRSWGVFEVTSEYTAIQAGSCMTIEP